MSKIRILPCPFCGSPASVEESDSRTGGGVVFSVGCDSKEEASCMGYQSFTVFPTRHAAITAWNRREPRSVARRELIGSALRARTLRHERMERCAMMKEAGVSINMRMSQKVNEGEAIDLSTADRDGVYYVVKEFVDDVDYCDNSKGAWIWSIGKRHRDGVILASLHPDLYQNPDFECLWLR